MAAVLQRDICRRLGSRIDGAYSVKRALQPQVLPANGNINSAVQNFRTDFFKNRRHMRKACTFFFNSK